MMECNIFSLSVLLVFMTSVRRSSPAQESPKGNAICTIGYFQCHNSTMCIPQLEECDGNFDCLDMSDESNCVDEDDDYYWDNKFKKKTSAHHDHLSDVCNLTFEQDPICVCKDTSLFCGFKSFIDLPKDLPNDQNIDLLDFEGNNFKILTGDMMRVLPTAINQLNFAHCNVDSIDKGTFYHLPTLQKLHLDNNNLRILQADLFAPGNNLTTLSVMHNRIWRISQGAFDHLDQLVELDLRGNKITMITNVTLLPLRSLKKLDLQNNGIRRVDLSTFPPLPLVVLSLDDNEIEILMRNAFAKLVELQKLFLSHNRLEHLRNGTFYNLTNLKILTLTDNAIETIDNDVFRDISRLNSLQLERNHLKDLDKNVLVPLEKLEFIYFDRFEMCGLALHVRVCSPKGDGISSHDHLLDNAILRASVWIMAAIGCTGNLIVLIGRILAPTTNVVHSLYLKNLAFSDLLMVVYLFAIAAADHHYRGVYLRYQHIWRHSYMCSICGFLGTLSCESSVLILTLVTYDRYVSVTQPLARKQPSPKQAALTLTLLWLAAIGVASVPLSKGYFGDEFYGNNGVCLPLHIHEPFAMGWEYSVVMFVFGNTLALSFICYAYFRMITEIKASGVACRSTRQSVEREKVAQRFGLIVLTDCLCWLPVIAIKLVALFGCSVPPDLYAWLAIFILPINSALNPVLYTLTTTVFKKQMRSTMNRCVRKRKKRYNSASESGLSFSLGVVQLNGSSRRVFSHRGTQSSLTGSKSSWNRQKSTV